MVWVALRSAEPFSRPRADLESSRYQSQYSCQMNWYSADAASLKRYSASADCTSLTIEFRRESIHRSASDVFGAMSSEFGVNPSSRFMNTNLLAFQILFAKLR